jgi:lipopolysaccharide assembly protein A
MRVLCFLFLVAFVGAVVAFALQNQQEITLSFFKWNLSLSVAIVTGGAFLLGMLSGWSIVGILRRSLRRVTESERQYAAR